MTQPGPLTEVRLGRGDYIAGGACGEPFLYREDDVHRRPVIFGEVSTVCDPLLAGMFQHGTTNPVGWAVAWRELGADGICLRTSGMTADEAVETVSSIIMFTGLPVAIDGPKENVIACSKAVGDSTLILIGDYCNDDRGMHALATELRNANGDDRIVHMKGMFPDPAPFREALAIRKAALEGEGCRAPILFDVTPVWEQGATDAGTITMLEGEAALVAMMHGADIVIVRGPNALDLALFYGEELADL